MAFRKVSGGEEHSRWCKHLQEGMNGEQCLPFHRNGTWLGGYKGRFGDSPGKWQSVWLHQGQEEGLWRACGLRKQLSQLAGGRRMAVAGGWGGQRDDGRGSSRTVE